MTGNVSYREINDVVQTWEAPAIDESQIQKIVRDINTSGFAQLENFLPLDVLGSLQSFILQKVADSGNEYLGLIGSQSVEKTVLAQLSASAQFNKLLQRLFEIATKKRAPNQTIYQMVRCLTGQSGLVHNYYFHYDSYVVTALLPLIIPTEGQAGDLILSTRRRKLTKSYLLNLFDKLVLNTKFRQKALKAQAVAGTHGFEKVHMIPGNIYFFWGYSTCHANEPCDPNQVRATALFHFGDPYTKNRLRRLTGKAVVRSEPKVA